MQSGDLVMEELRAAPVPVGENVPLAHMVVDLADAAGIPVPTVWVIPSPEPNALSVGESPYISAIGITTAALQWLHPREVKAVMAHEIGHVVAGHLADRTASALKLLGGAARSVGAGGLQLAQVISGIHPVLAVAVGATSVGVRAYGTGKVNAGFEINRAQEMEADSFAYRLGLGHALASALARISRNSVRHGLLPEWVNGLLFSGHLNTNDHPPISQRLRAAQALPTMITMEYCRVCWSPFGVNGRCRHECDTFKDRYCRCGNTILFDHRYCDACGQAVADTPCRFCGNRDDRHLPYCTSCGFPLP